MEDCSERKKMEQNMVERAVETDTKRIKRGGQAHLIYIMKHCSHCWRVVVMWRAPTLTATTAPRGGLGSRDVTDLPFQGSPCTETTVCIHPILDLPISEWDRL